MKQLHKAALAAALALGTLASANASIIITEPGVDGFNIETLAFNGSSYTITAVTTGGVFKGTFAKVGNTPDVSAVLSPVTPAVPEAGSFALTLAGLAAVGGIAARRRKA